MRLPNYSEKKANKVIELYKSGLTKKEIAGKVRLNYNQVQWIIQKIGYKKIQARVVEKTPRNPNKTDFGCIVCACSTKSGGKGFCSKHYYRYVTRPERIRKIKGL